MSGRTARARRKYEPFAPREERLAELMAVDGFSRETAEEMDSTWHADPATVVTGPKCGCGAQ